MTKLKKPNYIHHDKFFDGMQHLYEFFQSEPENQTAIASAIVVRNSITLLNGTYGTGKTQLVNLIKRMFFVDDDGKYDYDYETCHQDLTAIDVLYHLDLAELQKGEEIVRPKKIVKARLKFLNEIQRANPTLYNALLPLLSERAITYRDKTFDSPNFILMMDQNPHDAASSIIPKAFYDRIDFKINFPTIRIESSLNLFNKRNLSEGIQWDSLEKLTDKHLLKSSQMEEIWEDVTRVRINEYELMMANLIIGSFSVCIKADRSLLGKNYILDCQSCKFLGEVCSHLNEVPGYRSLNSTLKLSQARAWLAQRETITIDDILFSIPYTLSHRLNIKREELSITSNSFDWVKHKALGEILKDKFESWDKAIHAYKQNDHEQLTEIATENLIVANLLK